jgi:O-methyltransferase/aklanonic acid methyltransferase
MTKDVLAGVYDRAAVGYGDVRYFPIYARRLVDLAEVPADGRVLDVACGRGAVLFEISRRLGAGVSITGVDLAEGMVVHTAREITRQGLQNAETIQMDAENLAFPDGLFDRVFCAFSLQFLPDPEGVARVPSRPETVGRSSRQHVGARRPALGLVQRAGRHTEGEAESS